MRSHFYVRHQNCCNNYILDQRVLTLVKGKKQFRYQVRPNPLPSDHWLYRPDQGGRTIGEISHFIDLIGYLTGAEMISLSCDWIDRKAGDSVWYMHFADGSRGEVS